MKQDLPRSTTSLRLLCETAAEHGVARGDCLENTGVSAADLERDDARLTLAQELQAIENVARLAPAKAGLGVAVGRRLHVHAFGVWGFAVLTSPTLRSAILTAIDYVKLSFVIADMTLADDSDAARLMFETAQLPAITRPYILERHAVVAMTFIRELIQQPEFCDFTIETTMTDAAYTDELSRLLEIEVIGGASMDALVWPARLMDAPLPKSDPVSLRYCLDQCKMLVDRIDGAMPPWSQKVRDAVIEDIASEQKIDNIAAKLSVTARTLRRRLTEEGTSFRDIYTDARLTIAHELLDAAGLNVETVAWRVGYAEPASFVRAFSRKYDKTPGEVRKRL